MPAERVDLSILTSLYRSEAFLPAFVDHVLRVGAEVQAAGLTLEIVLIPNDARPAERAQLERLEQAATFPVRALHVPREGLYASWNRGMDAVQGTSVAVWNVDDIRASAALIEGCRLIEGGCLLVDFPFTLRITPSRKLGIASEIVRAMPPFWMDVEGAMDFDRPRPGNLFMFARSLFEQVGPFDVRFRVAGDFDWHIRAARITHFCAGSTQAGTFILHGGNLSSPIGGLVRVEENIVRMLYSEWRGLNIVPPWQMRAVWKIWNTHPVPAGVARRLWGPPAYFIYGLALIRQQAYALYVRVRTLASVFVERAGLRPVLAKLGIVNPTPLTER